MTEVALVVGSDDKVTSEIVNLLLARGSRVGLVTAAACSVPRSDGVTAVIADLADSASLATAVETVRDQIGQFSTVVSIPQATSTGRIHEVALADWALAIDHGVTSVYLVAKHTLDDLMGTSGSFVAVTSTGAVRGVGAHGAQAAAAHGIVGLVKSMAIDYARQGVRCNVVSAGYVDADNENGAFGIREVPNDRIPSRRPATAREVAHLVGHLTSQRSSYATGAVFVLDGALTAGMLKEA